MPYGIQLLNSSNRVQVDESSKVPRLISSGYAPVLSGYLGASYAEASISIPVSITQELVVCLVRPALANKYVGYMAAGYPNDGYGIPTGGSTQSIFLGGQCAFDWAVFMYNGTPITDSSAYGLEVYSNTGSIIYSSKHQHPRISQMALMPANTNKATRFGYPYTATISGYSSMPWLVANVYMGSGSYDPGISGSSGVMGAVNSAFTQLTIDLRDVEQGFQGYQSFDFAPWNSSYPSSTLEYLNPYYGINAYFPVATFA